MTHTLKRLSALALCLLLLLGLLPAPALAEGGVVTVSTEAELLDLAKNCALDAWSRDKTVRLTADLDLTGLDFTPIPSFSGRFDGNGHTIRGLSLRGAGSVMGFFRYLEEGALVRDLHLEGTVAPGGSRETVGGLAGSSAGRVLACSFTGTVEGASAVGGLVGENRAAGAVEGCSFSGSVTGQSRCGGVAGLNRGTLSRCVNQGDVNTAPAEAASLSELADAGLEGALSLLNGAVESAGGSALGLRSDAGGLAGFSTGLITDCVNEGTVGYPHQGYNVGGIAGRQTGLILGCRNSGTVYGRKDVGGIVGQAEPDILILLREEDKVPLRQELSKLSAMVDRATALAGSGSGLLSGDLTAIGQAADRARDSGGALLRAGEDLLSENMDALNGLAALLTGAAAELPAGFDALGEGAGALVTAGERLRDAFAGLGDAADETDPFIRELSELPELFTPAEGTLNSAMNEAERAAEELHGAIAARDEETAGQALSDLADAAAQGASAVLRLKELLARMETAVKEREGLEALREPLREAVTQVERLAEALSAQRNAALVLISQLRFDPILFRASLRDFGIALSLVREAGDGAADALREAAAAFETVEPALGELGDAMGELSAFAAALARAFAALPDAFSAFSEAAEALNGVPALISGSDAAREAQEDLLAALGDVSSGLSALNGRAASLSGELTEALSAVNGQLTRVLELLLDRVESLQEEAESLDLSDLLEDASDEAPASAPSGRLSLCVNEGSVEGDRSVGGIAGSMAMELELDPEDDSPLRPQYGASYRSKAVLDRCAQRGGVLCKKDCAGGLVGRMDLGSLVGCESSGSVEGGGDYVGGAAGLSEGTIRGCFIRGSVSGGSRVGGAAGSGSVIRSCVVLARVKGSGEYLGAVAGWAEPRSGKVTDNVFLDLGAAGIDSVSYAGAAEPVSYEALAAREDLPEGFLRFTLTLKAEGEAVAALPFSFGEDLSRFELPPVPEKEGYFGRWPALSAEDAAGDLSLEAVYSRLIPLLPSGAETAEGFPLAYAEGSFTDRAVLEAEELSAEDGARRYALRLTGEEAPLPLALRLRTGGEAPRLFLEDGAERRELSYTVRGSYICFTVPEAACTLLLTPEKQAPSLLLPLCAGAAVLLAILLLLLRKRHKNKKSKQTSAS